MVANARPFALALMLVASAWPFPSAAAESGHAISTAVEHVRVAVKIGDKTLTATLVDNNAARDFAAQLPLDLTMDDLLEREKYAHIPNAVDQGMPRTHHFRVGDIAYWSPSQDVAIFYRQDGATIPPPGLIPLARIGAGVEAFDVRGPVRVHIELAR